jgi:hypothetical protein
MRFSISAPDGDVGMPPDALNLVRKAVERRASDLARYLPDAIQRRAGALPVKTRIYG